jgi:hypothetical protein
MRPDLPGWVKNLPRCVQNLPQPIQSLSERAQNFSGCVQNLSGCIQKFLYTACFGGWGVAHRREEARMEKGGDVREHAPADWGYLDVSGLGVGLGESGAPAGGLSGGLVAALRGRPRNGCTPYATSFSLSAPKCWRAPVRIRSTSACPWRRVFCSFFEASCLPTVRASSSFVRRAEVRGRWDGGSLETPDRSPQTISGA